MLALGLCDGHDAGACLVQDGRLVAAVSSERLTRTKRQPGFPAEAIRWCLKRHGVHAGDLDRVAVAERSGRSAHRSLNRFYRRADPNQRFTRPSNLLSMTAQNLLAAGRVTAPLDAALSLRILTRSLAREGITSRPRLVDHHLAHALTAARGSGVIDDALVLTMDAFGDGCSGGVWRWRGGQLSELRRFLFPHSPALLYGLVTAHLGLREGDEGKVAGMAAGGDADATRSLFEAHLSACDGEVRLLRPLRLARLGRALRGYSAADVAAGLQATVEDRVGAVAAFWARQTGAKVLCLAGGLFANVRLNQRTARAARCQDLYVFPHMGDGGLCVGAALAMEPDARGAARNRMFLGPRPGPLPEDLRAATRARIAPLDEDALDAVAKVLARGGMVGVAAGPLEFGPRALGNRSILLPANDPRLARRLNAALGRAEVMPLAPVVRDSDLPLVTADPPWSALEEMTATVDAAPGLARRFPVAVHTDGTMRLQLATRQGTPLLHRILTSYSHHADLALLINTSLNLHSEPIVRTARRAVELYRQLPLDALVLDDQVLLRSAP